MESILLQKPGIQAQIQGAQGFKNQTQLYRFLAVLELPDPQATDSDFLRQLTLRPATLLPLIPDQLAESFHCLDSHRSFVNAECVRLQSQN